ncbi:MAG: adenosylmethionine decarboxylase [Clostridiales bacterium]|nr:adenosylmethionine decarboxylase [Clostridiales bacterium]
MIVKGLHVLAEIHDCDEKLLQDLSKLESLVKDAAGENGFTVEDSVFHQFSPSGISGVVVVPDANLSIHTWPEGRSVTVDMVTCREDLNPIPSCETLVSKFRASHMTATSREREIDLGSAALAV